jgi:hypothetical protein
MGMRCIYKYLRKCMAGAAHLSLLFTAAFSTVGFFPRMKGGSLLGGAGADSIYITLFIKRSGKRAMYMYVCMYCMRPVLAF